MKETNASLYISFLNKLSSPARDAMLRSSDVQSGWVLLFTLLHYLTSVTKSERLLALEIFLSYDMCIWRELFQFNFVVDKYYIGFFLYILRAFTVLSLVLSFILFLDTIF